MEHGDGETLVDVRRTDFSRRSVATVADNIVGIVVQCALNRLMAAALKDQLGKRKEVWPARYGHSSGPACQANRNESILFCRKLRYRPQLTDAEPSVS